MRSIPRTAIFLLLAIGCAEDPTSVGIGLLPPTDLPVFNVDTLEATAINTSKGIPLTHRLDTDLLPWNPAHLFVGGVQTLVSGSFVRFDKLPDSLTGITVTAADLILTPTVVIGDSTTTPSVTYHRPLRTWLGDSLSIDSLTLQPGVYFDLTPLPVGFGTGTVDTGGAVTLPLDTGLVRQWFITTVDSGTTNLGVYMKGTANGLIQGYGSFSNPTAAIRPRLRVAYLKNGVPNTIEFSSGSSRYLADLPSNDLIVDPAKMYIQAGVSYRGIVTFDLSALPQPISISETLLELTLDSTVSDRSGGPDSLFAIYMESGGAIEKRVAVASIRTTVNGNPVYAFGIPFYAQQWLRTNTPARVVIAAFSESSTFGRFVIHGPTAASELRPRIIITYSKAIATRGARP